MMTLRCDELEAALLHLPSATTTVPLNTSFAGELSCCRAPAFTNDAAVARKLIREALQFLTMLSAPEARSPRAAAFRKLNAHLAGRCTLGQAVRLTLDPGGVLLGPLTVEHLRAYVELRERQLRPEADFPAELILLEHWRQQAGL